MKCDDAYTAVNSEFLCFVVDKSEIMAEKDVVKVCCDF